MNKIVIKILQGSVVTQPC